MRQGYIMDLHPDPWTRIDRKARNAVKKALKNEVYIRDGSLGELKTLHWNPVYLPFQLNKHQKIYAAEVYEERPISVILVEENIDHVVYRYAANHPDYKGLQGNSLLVWYLAEKYRPDIYKYVDLGGSQQPSIEAFKKQFATRSYPIADKRTLTKRVAHRVHQLKYIIREAAQ